LKFNATRRRSSVGKRFIEARAVLQFSSLKNFAAVEALDVLRVVVLGNQSRAFMFAGRIRHVHLFGNLVEL